MNISSTNGVERLPSHSPLSQVTTPLNITAGKIPKPKPTLEPSKSSLNQRVQNLNKKSQEKAEAILKDLNEVIYKLKDLLQLESKRSGLSSLDSLLQELKTVEMPSKPIAEFWRKIPLLTDPKAETTQIDSFKKEFSLFRDELEPINTKCQLITRDVHQQLKPINDAGMQATNAQLSYREQLSNVFNTLRKITFQISRETKCIDAAIDFLPSLKEHCLKRRECLERLQEKKYNANGTPKGSSNPKAPQPKDAPEWEILEEEFNLLRLSSFDLEMESLELELKRMRFHCQLSGMKIPAACENGFDTHINSLKSAKSSTTVAIQSIESEIISDKDFGKLLSEQEIAKMSSDKADRYRKENLRRYEGDFLEIRKKVCSEIIKNREVIYSEFAKQFNNYSEWLKLRVKNEKEDLNSFAIHGDELKKEIPEALLQIIKEVDNESNHLLKIGNDLWSESCKLAQTLENKASQIGHCFRNGRVMPFDSLSSGPIGYYLMWRDSQDFMMTCLQAKELPLFT